MNKSKSYNSKVIDDLLREISPEELTRTEKRMLLAARIDEAIKAKGWKKNKFAEVIGKNPSEVTKWLSGTHNFTADTLFDIERVLNIHLLRLENRQETTYKTYVFSVSNRLTDYPDIFWQKIINEPFYISTFKQKVTPIGNKTKDVNHTK